MNSIVVFIKYPEPGAVKTRLAKDIGMQRAADLYRTFIFQTLDLTRQSKADSVHIAFSPAAKQRQMRKLLPNAFKIFPQHGADLGQRMLNAFEQLITQGADKVVIIGSDSPTLSAELIDEAFAQLDAHDLVLGPAEDGGYYLIGLKRIHRELFTDIEWSTEAVLALTVKRAEKLGVSYTLLPEWYDVDDVTTLLRAAKDDDSGRIKKYLVAEEIIESP